MSNYMILYQHAKVLHKAILWLLFKSGLVLNNLCLWWAFRDLIENLSNTQIRLIKLWKEERS